MDNDERANCSLGVVLALLGLVSEVELIYFLRRLGKQSLMGGDRHKPSFSPPDLTFSPPDHALSLPDQSPDRQSVQLWMWWKKESRD